MHIIKEIRTVIFGLLLTIALAITGFVALCVVYMLPTAPMKENVKSAYDLFMDERVYHDWSNNVEFTRLDGYTDMIMYGTAIYEGNEGVVSEALLNRRMDKRGEEAMDLADYLSGKPGTYEPQSYERYWHGYLIWLKPLLLFMHPRNIRIFNMIVQFIMLAYLLRLMTTQLQGHFFVPVVVGILLLNPISTAMCLQYSSIYYISIISAIIELRYSELLQKKLYFSLFYLTIGICVAYFDFLTYPPIACCIPLLFYIAIRGNSDKDAYEQSRIESIIRAGSYWGFGYIGIWMIKWILPLLIGVNQFAELTEEIEYRSDLSSQSFCGLLIDKLRVITIKPILVMFLFVFVYMIVDIGKGKISKKGVKFVGIPIEKMLSYVMIGLIPLAWYFLARQHSSHTFAYRDIVGTIMAALFILEEFRLVNRGHFNAF